MPQPPDGGARYPANGARSRPKFCTLRPQWSGEKLELPLGGGQTDVDGTYHNSETAKAHLHVQMCDADVGMWGYLFYGSQLTLVVLMVCTVAAHVTGFADDLSDFVTRWVARAAMACAGVLVVAFIKSKVLNDDDEASPLTRRCRGERPSRLGRLRSLAGRRSAHGSVRDVVASALRL